MRGWGFDDGSPDILPGFYLGIPAPAGIRLSGLKRWCPGDVEVAISFKQNIKFIACSTIVFFPPRATSNMSERVNQIASHLNYPKGLLAGQVAIITGCWARNWCGMRQALRE